MAYKKGYAFERELKLKLESDGWYVIRSGGSKKPDLVAGKDKKIIIIECKVTKNKKIYLEKDEVSHLKDIAEAFGAEAVYAIKKNNCGWNLVSVSNLREIENSFTVDL